MAVPSEAGTVHLITSPCIGDYEVMGASFAERGAALDELIDALRATWSGQALEGAERPVGRRRTRREVH